MIIVLNEDTRKALNLNFTDSRNNAFCSGFCWLQAPVEEKNGFCFFNGDNKLYLRRRYNFRRLSAIFSFAESDPTWQNCPQLRNQDLPNSPHP
mmetsp:Transcript_13207/g.20078  ORF Transcript_13207/g.20078 Transcript_13207/m.20078 type:complete len:93 (+) Transcript_13207:798-1076(+)